MKKIIIQNLLAYNNTLNHTQIFMAKNKEIYTLSYLVYIELINALIKDNIFSNPAYETILEVTDIISLFVDKSFFSYIDKD